MNAIPSSPTVSAKHVKTLGEPIVRIDDVRKSFHGIEVLKGISVEVRRGEVVVLAGRSGSGKSTLLRCIDQLETIDSGSIRVNGELMGFREKDGRRVPLSDSQI
ncbi:MAG: ATP-binding cassette domain-containing protein, partial [Rhizobiaceae bacterium]